MTHSVRPSVSDFFLEIDSTELHQLGTIYSLIWWRVAPGFNVCKTFVFFTYVSWACLISGTGQNPVPEIRYLNPSRSGN